MSNEMIPYVKLLRSRGLAVSARELKSRFFRENPVTAVRRVMDQLERFQGKFTFFVVGVCAEANPAIVEEILNRGHEIACHGYNHIRFNLLSPEEIRRDLERALILFQNKFGYVLKGFRAPYLGMADHVYPVLKEMGFIYSSSVEETDGPFRHSSGIMEYPVSVDDWRILIKENRGAEGLYMEMLQSAQPGRSFLLHPWRVGQKRYVGALVRFLEEQSGTLRFVCMNILSANPRGIALTGDVGEFALREILSRSLSFKG